MLNGSVLRWRQKVVSDGTALSVQTEECSSVADAENARSPSVDRRVDGMTRELAIWHCGRPEMTTCRQSCMSDVSGKASARYGGAVAVLCRQRCVRAQRRNLILSTSEGHGEVESRVLTALPRIPTKQQHSALNGVDQRVIQRSQPALSCNRLLSTSARSRVSKALFDSERRALRICRSAAQQAPTVQH